MGRQEFYEEIRFTSHNLFPIIVLHCKTLDLKFKLYFFNEINFMLV